MELIIVNGVQIDSIRIERLILFLADEFDIRIEWDTNAAVATAVFGLLGGLIGGYKGGKLGAAIGAGFGGASGYAVSRFVSLREVWDSIKQNLKELFYVIVNYMTHLSPDDYRRAYDLIMSCAGNRRQLVMQIVEFIAQKLGREVVSRITAHAASLPANYNGY